MKKDVFVVSLLTVMLVVGGAAKAAQVLLDIDFSDKIVAGDEIIDEQGQVFFQLTAPAWVGEIENVTITFDDRLHIDAFRPVTIGLSPEIMPATESYEFSVTIEIDQFHATDFSEGGLSIYPRAWFDEDRNRPTGYQFIYAQWMPRIVLRSDLTDNPSMWRGSAEYKLEQGQKYTVRMLVETISPTVVQVAISVEPTGQDPTEPLFVYKETGDHVLLDGLPFIRFTRVGGYIDEVRIRTDF